MKFKQFLMEDETKKEKAEQMGLEMKSFNHATKGNENFEWIETTKTWAKIIDAVSKKQIKKFLHKAGFSESRPKQLLKDKAEFNKKGFTAKKVSATVANINKLKGLPSEGRKYYLNGTGTFYIIGWAHS